MGGENMILTKDFLQNEVNKYSGLNEMKLGFSTTITEYLGEFDIVLNNFTYNLYKSFNKNK